MNIDWSHLIAALALLWFPRQALRFGGDLLRFAHRRGSRDTNPAKTREPGDPALVFAKEFAKPRNYIDIARAVLGGEILLGGFPGMNPAIAPAIDASVTILQVILYLTLAVFIVGVLIQSFRFEGKVTMFPPIWYLAGLTFAVPGPKPAAFAFGLIWTLNLVFPNPTAFLTAYSVLIAIFGILFDGAGDLYAYFMAGLIFLPVLISLLAGRRLVLFSKRVKNGRSTATAT